MSQITCGTAGSLGNRPSAAGLLWLLGAMLWLLCHRAWAVQHEDDAGLCHIEIFPDELLLLKFDSNEAEGPPEYGLQQGHCPQQLPGNAVQSQPNQGLCRARQALAAMASAPCLLNIPHAQGGGPHIWICSTGFTVGYACHKFCLTGLHRQHSKQRAQSAGQIRKGR